LAAKIKEVKEAKKPISMEVKEVDEPISMKVVKEPYTRETSRIMYLNQKASPISSLQFIIFPERKLEIVTTIHQYLTDVEQADCMAKAVIATNLAKYLLQNPEFLAVYENFTHVVRVKMVEAKKECVGTRKITKALNEAASDLLYVIS
jgi:hypothetical protein